MNSLIFEAIHELDFQNGTTTSELPNDWDQQGLEMGYKVAYLFKIYNIHAALMVNNDQIGLHLVPTTQEWTLDSKGAKHIKASRIEDKKHVTLVSSFAWMDCFYPFKLFLQIPCIKHYP
jgi:hypothetical protein